MMLRPVLLLASILLSTSISTLGETIRGASDDLKDSPRELQGIDEEVTHRFMYGVRITADDLSEMRQCFNRDNLDMGAMILSVLRTAYMDYPNVEFDTINFRGRNEERRAEEEGHRQLGSYNWEGLGACRRCRNNNGDRRELSVMTDRMERALKLAIKQTFLEVRKDNCLSGLNARLQAAVNFYN